jgi:hypothetical protein
LIDLVSPVKKEIMKHAEDVANPSCYSPYRLHGDLQPTFNEPAFNKGQYQLVGCGRGRITTYIYTFHNATTIGASVSNRVNLELEKITDNTPCKLGDIFTSTSSIQFTLFKVPSYFIAEGDHEVALEKSREEGIQKGIEEGIQRIVLELKKNGVVSDEMMTPMVNLVLHPQVTDAPPTPSTTPVSPMHEVDGDIQESSELVDEAIRNDGHPEGIPNAEDIPKLKGDEAIRNERLYAWITQQLENLPEDYVFSCDEPSSHSVSRHHKSEQDFSWYIKPTCSNLNAGCGSVHTSEEPKEYTENCDLHGISGDSKMNASEKHIYQLFANMNKTSADLAFDALRAGVIFNKITIYGLLLGYEQNMITKIYVLVLDFVKMKSSLRQVIHTEDISIEDGFSMVTSQLQQSIVLRN